MTGTYENFKKDFLRLSGIDLNSYKENQMKRRIENFMLKKSVLGYDAFIDVLSKDAAMYDKFVEHLTINVSEFFRNPVQWNTLEQIVIPQLLEKFGRPLKIWSAACSTGDEPYSLAMVLSEFLPLNQIEIIATDLDREVLAKAKTGIYSEKSLKGIPEKYMKKYMKEIDDGMFRVSEQLKSCITFKQHNLLKDPYPKGIHMIVCRNVMIYFTEEAKNDIYTHFADSLCKEGILFVGSTEQIIGAAKYGYHSIQSFFYQKQ